MIPTWRLWSLTTLALMTLAGCLPIDPEGDDLVAGFLPNFSGDVRYESEPNNSLETADAVNWETSIELNGTIGGSSRDIDVDVFALGPAEPGDHLTATLDVRNTADIVLGLYNEHGHLLSFVDLSSSSSGPSMADLVVQQPIAQVYAVVTSRSLSSGARAYSAQINVERGVSAIGYRPQIVLLSFEGAAGVRIGGRPPVDVPPFDPANIDSRFAGQADTIIENVLSMVRQDFAGLNVEVYLSTDGNIPPGQYTTVYFGTYDPMLLGLADNIDPFNTDNEQAAIIYTDTFAVFKALSPGTQAISRALANVASHEIGHLLGLRHTADPNDIMDITATARRMLQLQRFSIASLHPTVISFGLQDSPTLLAWTLGGALLPPPPSSLKPLQRPVLDFDTTAPDFYIPRSMLMMCSCGDCQEQ